jgi:hypothetical protein
MLAAERVAHPLTAARRLPGDRIRLRGGSRKR